MPEIAECRRYVDQLTAEFGGQSLLNVEVVGGRFLKEAPDGLGLLTFPLNNAQFKAKGKFIYFDFDDPNVPEDEGGKTYFFITLGMSASFGRRNKHSAVRFQFDTGEVFYNDIRHFGTIKVGLNPNELNKKLNELGWDALDASTGYPTNDIVIKLGKRGHKTIAEVLLDQKVFAGVGNYIRSEVLYRVGIHPNTLCQNLTFSNIVKICEAIFDIAREAYHAGGATLATYSDLYGNVGTYYNQFKVYGKKQDPLGRAVVRLTAADGRTVHFVPEAQVLQ